MAPRPSSSTDSILGGFSTETKLAGPAPEVVMVRLHPPAKLPWSPGPSSNRYKDQVPLAPVPLNADNVAPYGPGGAGLGKVSPPSEASHSLASLNETLN